MKILTITNNITVSDYLTEILKKEKYIVKQAKTGEEGFSLLNKISFNLILLDLNLPDMQGINILKHVRKKQNTLELPVIILGAFKSYDTILHKPEFKANDFLDEFFDELSLLLKVRNLLQLQQLNQQSNANSAKLKQSEKQLNAIFAFAPTVMLVADKNARILRLNKTAEIFLNQTQEQVYGKLAGDVIRCVYALAAPNSCGTYECCKFCGLRTSVTETITNQKEIYKRKGFFTVLDGKSSKNLTLSISTTLLEVENEQQVLLNVDDITNEEKYIDDLKDKNDKLEAQAEELRQMTEHLNSTNKLLEESKEHFRALFNNSADGLIIHDNKKIINVNDEFLKMRDIKREQIENQSIRKLLSSFSYSKKVGENLPKEDIDYEFELPAQGNIPKMFVEIKSKGFEKNNIQYKLVSIKDITERKKAELIIKTNEARLNAMINTTMTGVSIHDFEGFHLFTNPAAEKIHGYKAKEIIGKHFELTVHPDDINVSQAVMKEFITGKVKFLSKEIRLVHKTTKKAVWILMNISVYPKLFGKDRDNYLIIFQDISKQKAIEKELKDLNATKDKFFSILGHDLRSPFTTLIGFSNMLVENLDVYDRKEIKKYVAYINNTSKQTFELLENLFEWARNQQYKTPFQLEEMDLLPLINKSYKTVNYTAIAKNIKIIIDVPENIKIVGDKEMINTVLRNLISNAIKFTNKNGSIYIDAGKNTENVFIKITDTGVGMNEKTKETLFKLSETKSLKGTDGERGTGFGLMICKEFIEKHDGQISVESELGKGSKFIIKLPISKDK